MPCAKSLTWLVLFDSPSNQRKGERGEGKEMNVGKSMGMNSPISSRRHTSISPGRLALESNL